MTKCSKNSVRSISSRLWKIVLSGVIRPSCTRVVWETDRSKFSLMTMLLTLWALRFSTSVSSPNSIFSVSLNCR